jgi:hypothetical protein
MKRQSRLCSGKPQSREMSAEAPAYYSDTTSMAKLSKFAA